MTLPPGARAGAAGGVRPGTLLAVLVAAATLTGAGAVTLFGDGDPNRPPAVPRPPAPAPTPAAGPTREAVSASSMTEAAAWEPLLTAPPAEWRRFGDVPLPYSVSAGPRTVRGPVHAGFERSQAGALLAAVHLSVRYLLTPGEGWREVVQQQVLPGPGRDVFVRLRGTVDGTALPGSYGHPAGFRVVAYTADLAVLQLVSRFPRTGNLQVSTVTLRWVGGDWRLQLQPDGSSSPTVQTVSDLDGFVVWGG